MKCALYADFDTKMTVLGSAVIELEHFLSNFGVRIFRCHGNAGDRRKAYIFPTKNIQLSRNTITQLLANRQEN